MSDEHIVIYLFGLILIRARMVSAIDFRIAAPSLNITA